MALTVAAANRLLGNEPWARERLAAFAGRAFMVRVGPATTAFRIDARGLFENAPLAGVTPDMKVLAEEVFAPVAMVISCDDFEEALRQAVEEQAQARVAGDIAKFASYITPQALLRLHRQGEPLRAPQGAGEEGVDGGGDGQFAGEDGPHRLADDAARPRPLRLTTVQLANAGRHHRVPRDRARYRHESGRRRPARSPRTRAADHARLSHRSVQPLLARRS